MKRRDFDFEVMHSAPVGNVRLVAKERECSVNCYELVFGKESGGRKEKESGVSRKDKDNGEEDGGALFLATAIVCIAILGLALLILAL